MADYPSWMYFPTQNRPPDWVHEFVGIVASVRKAIESHSVDDRTSDRVLAELRPGLIAVGYEIETGKKAADLIKRPVLFGEAGEARMKSTESMTIWAL